MKTIYKYQLEPKVRNVLWLKGPIVSAGVQGGDIMIWAIHDDDEPLRDVTIDVKATGDPFTGTEGVFIGTVFLGRLVFHVFATLT